MKFVLAIIMALFLAACSVPQYLYYGNTSHSYYKVVKKQDAKSIEQYKASLQKVFTYSQKKSMPVPPGLYCDYAMLMLSENNTQEAKVYFQKEAEAWSESQPLMTFLMKRYGITQ